MNCIRAKLFHLSPPQIPEEGGGLLSLELMSFVESAKGQMGNIQLYGEHAVIGRVQTYRPLQSLQNWVLGMDFSFTSMVQPMG